MMSGRVPKKDVLGSGCKLEGLYVTQMRRKIRCARKKIARLSKKEITKLIEM